MTRKGEFYKILHHPLCRRFAIIQNNKPERTHNVMDTGDICAAIGGSALLLAIVVYILRGILRSSVFLFLVFAILGVIGSATGDTLWYWCAGIVALLWLYSLTRRSKPKKQNAVIKYRYLADFAAAVEKGDATIDANIRNVFADIAEQLDSIAGKMKDGEELEMLKNKMRFVDVIAAAKIKGSDNAQILGVSDLLELVEERRVTLDPSTKNALVEIYDLVDEIDIDGGDDDQLDVVMLSSDLEQILYPNGITEKQALAISKRRSKKAPRKTVSRGHAVV